jgi:TolB protein
MTMKKNTIAFIFLFLWQSFASADLIIEISNSSDDAIPVAIIPIKITKGGVPKTDIAKVIADDLYRSGKFKAVSDEKLPSLPASIDEIDYLEWRLLDIDNMMIGEVTLNENGNYNVELRFIDLLRKKEVIAKRWENVSEIFLRQVAHKMSDEIYKELTGVRGAFNTKMAYVTVKKKDKKNQYTLEIADADGFNAQPVLKSASPIMSPSWSPDGKSLAYVTFENGRSEIVVQSLDGKNREIIASYQGINGAPAWSEDGKKMLMTLSKQGSADIFIMNLKTKKLRRITRNYAIETEAVWSPNGRSVFYNSDQRGQPQVFQAFLDTGEIKRISFEGRYNSNPAVSPDGRYIAMVHSGKGFNIGLLDLYTKEFNVITDTFLDESPSFSPNGEMILYAMNHKGKARLAVVSIDHSVTQILSTLDGEVRSPSWGPFLD